MLECCFAIYIRLPVVWNFGWKNGIEYSYFKYKGAALIKIKKHRIIKSGRYRIFRNIEQLRIDKRDFREKLKLYRQRFQRHNYKLVDISRHLRKITTQAESVGAMVKTRVKDFVLDNYDGRIYAMAITFCRSKNKIQKQLELEYAGYVPGHGRRRKNNAKEIVSGLSALARHIHRELQEILKPSIERKFDFIRKAYAKR